jgi:glutamyl-Q tRNA(Asp) synthetase
MYKGRFAPSPTGPLHFGSLVAALASYLDALSAGGEWLVRMEDLDTARTVAGADLHILHTLEQFGFKWSGPVVYQSCRSDAYRAALDRLRQQNMAYPCSCSRRELVGSVYPGTCREGVRDPEKPQAWRVRVDDLAISSDGDFVVRRSDGLFAYQLAVVVDDAAQGITDVVRGADLLDSTPRQIYLQKLLRLPHPRYLHVPVVTNAAGEKLSKQTFAPALNAAEPAGELKDALRFLGQPAPEGTTPREILLAAITNWNPAAIPPRLSAPRA